ncbi:MerR family transcriptional regulator [Terribacillus saccharophilus]|uniref:MerR family transcriptional regulator n=1 Tax=Terribacillus saccharophilus TaxID=361277 RepID=UPI0039821D12
MKTYTISEVAKELNVTAYTLRYYDKEGLLPFVERTSKGQRLFKESDIAALKIIECLKNTGMSIKGIKNFIDWCADGDSTLQQRFDMFMERKAAVEKQIKDLQDTLGLIEHKCHYYKTSLEAGTEAIHKQDKLEIPVTTT